MCEGDEMGAQILSRALDAPTRQIAENSTVDCGLQGIRGPHGRGIIDAKRKKSARTPRENVL